MQIDGFTLYGKQLELTRSRCTCVNVIILSIK